MWGQIAIAGANLLSGLMGSSAESKSRKLHQQQLAQSQAQFDAQMDQTIQRRVADAQAAGIHPLFALGASAGASPTISSGGVPQTGNAMGDAISKIAGQLGMIEVNKAAANRDNAEAAYYNSLVARGAQNGASQGRDAGMESGEISPVLSNKPVPGKAQYVEPERPKTMATGVEAGEIPTHVRVTGPDGMSYDIVNPKLFDDITQPAFWHWAVQQARHWTSEKIEAIKNAASVGTESQVRKRLHAINRAIIESGNKNYKPPTRKRRLRNRSRQ